MPRILKKSLIDGEDTAEGVGVFTQRDVEELKERNRLKEGKYTGLGHNKI